jgi:hypothetical protein
MRGFGGMGGLKSADASRVVSAEEGQDSFTWPTTRDTASLQLWV